MYKNDFILFSYLIDILAGYDFSLISVRIKFSYK